MRCFYDEHGATRLSGPGQATTTAKTEEFRALQWGKVQKGM